MNGASSPPRRGVASWHVWFVTLGAIWGCSFWWIKLGLRAMSPVDVAFARLVIGALTLLLIATFTRSSLPRRPRTWGHLFVVAVLLNSAPFTLFSYGETHVSAVLAGLLNAVTPLATLIVVVFVLRQETLTAEIGTGLALGLLGVVVLIGAWRGFGANEWWGVSACLGAVVCYGFGFSYARRYLSSPDVSPVGLASGQVCWATLQLAPFALAFGHVQAQRPWSSVFAVVALGALGTGVAYTMNFHLVRHAPASVVSSVTYLTPVFAVVVGVSFLGESLRWNEPAGAILIIIGAALAQGRFSRRPSPAAVADPR